MRKFALKILLDWWKNELLKLEYNKHRSALVDSIDHILEDINDSGV